MNERESVTSVITNEAGQTFTTTTETGQESSVEITQNAKGEPRVTVKCYHADEAVALANALRIYREAISCLGGVAC